VLSRLATVRTLDDESLLTTNLKNYLGRLEVLDKATREVVASMALLVRDLVR
jgi:hypothetical protein